LGKRIVRRKARLLTEWVRLAEGTRLLAIRRRLLTKRIRWLAKRVCLLLAKGIRWLTKRILRLLKSWLLLHRRQLATALRASRRRIGDHRHHERRATLAASNWLAHGKTHG
jgi:hypothetical protein